jgi:hypothetical protein
MAEVFVSYASPGWETALKIAAFLEGGEFFISSAQRFDANKKTQVRRSCR